MPAAIRTVQAAAGRAEKEPYLAIDDASGLLALSQLDAIKLYPNGARAVLPQRPVFDLDPAKGLPFAVAAPAHVSK